MAIRSVTPAHANRVDREMNRLLSAFFHELPGTMPANRSVAINVWEENDLWHVEAELPGVAPEQLDVSVINDELTISVERPEAAAEENAHYFRRERPRGSVSRTIQLPAGIDSHRVKVSLAHGVLTVCLPKPEAARRRKIQVNTAS